MAQHKGLAQTLCTESVCVTPRPAVLERIIVHALEDGGYVTAYNGRNVDGDSLGSFLGLAGVTNDVKLGVLCEDGIYLHFPPYVGANKLANGGFETAGVGDPDFWANWVGSVEDGVIADEGVIVHSGSHACKMTAGVTALTRIEQGSVPISAGSVYMLSFWTEGDGTNDGIYYVYNGDWSAILIGVTHTGIVGTDYQKVEAVFVGPVGQTECIPIFRSSVVNGGIAYFDDVSVLAERTVSSILVIWRPLAEP